MSNTRKVHVKSFGCQMNVYDSQRMADTLAPAGFSEAATPDDADLVILNTCHIREKAAEKVYSEIGRIRVLKEEPRAKAARCWSRSPAAWRRPRARKSCAAPAPSIWWSGRRTITACRNWWRARPQARSRRHRVPGRGQVRGAGRAGARGDPQARRVELRHRAGRLRQVLHLLRRALYARRRSLAAGGADRRRSRTPGRRRRARGHADRAERQRLSRRPDRTAPTGRSRDCCAASPRCPASRACATPPAIRATCSTT